MFNLYTKGCEYAIRILIQAIKNDEPCFSLRKLCRRMKISESFARKVFQDLARKKIVKAMRGPGGGYALTEQSFNLSLHEIILAIDGKNAFDHCVMGLPQCHDKNPCVFHETWTKMKKDAIKRLSSQTLTDLVNADKDK